MNLCFVVDLPHDRSKAAMIVEPTCKIDDPAKLLNWLKVNGYKNLIREMQGGNLNDLVLPLGNAIFEESSYQTFCDQLCLHRCRAAREELQQAIFQLYAESF